MTTITVNPGTAKGKNSIEVSGGVQISGSGIQKDKYCGNLNMYWVTRKALDKLAKQHEVQYAN